MTCSQNTRGNAATNVGHSVVVNSETAPRNVTFTSDPATLGTTPPIWKDPAWIAEIDDTTLGEGD